MAHSRNRSPTKPSNVSIVCRHARIWEWMRHKHLKPPQINPEIVAFLKCSQEIRTSLKRTLARRQNNANKCSWNLKMWVCSQQYLVKCSIGEKMVKRSGGARLYSPSSLMRCCLLRRESRSKEKSDHSSRGGKEMVWRSVKRTASMTRSPRASVAPTLTLEAPLVVRTMWGGGEKSMACRCSMIPFQMMCWNSEGIFSLDKS